MSFADLLGRNDNRTSDDESELLQEMEDFDSNADEDGSASEVSPTELSDDSESSVEYQNGVNVEEEDSDLDDSQLTSSDSIGSATPTAVKRPIKRTESDFESCDYCRLKVSTEDCKICKCGTVCCDGCFDTVFRCGHLCDFTCEECCEKGIYCNRMAILQCEACSYDHHQRCGCDYINTPDESSEDDEVYRKCDYCSVENGLSSMHRCTCGTLCCEDCFPRVEKCGYECTFTCIDCCQGVYCFKENYPQCKHCAEDHLERCGCNDDFSGTEYGSSSNGTNSSESDESDSDEDSDIPYNFIL